MTEFVTPADIIDARADLSEETVRRCCRLGLIPGAIKAGRSWVIPADAAERFAETYEKHRPNATEPAATPAAGSANPPTKED